MSDGLIWGYAWRQAAGRAGGRVVSWHADGQVLEQAACGLTKPLGNRFPSGLLKLPNAIWGNSLILINP